MVESAYIHIPFCKQKCNYCSFVSYSKLELKEKYIEALLKEINSRYQGEYLHTVYFGGGTPSLINIEDFEKILTPLKILNIKPQTSPQGKEVNSINSAEITVEINPETVDEKYLKQLKEIGVNRLSIGVQDFHDAILKNIGRIHSSQKAKNTVRIAQKAGFENISIDLIYGLPNQTKEMFLENINIAFSLDVQHISLYGLKIEEGCYFYSHMPKKLPDDDTQADYYLSAIDACKNNGFKHYEVSNFAKPEFESKHNLNYWNNQNYYGFGCSASGYENNIRYYNEKNLEKYIENPLKKLRDDILTPKQQMEEEIFLGFRKCEGINVDKINKKFNIDFEKIFGKVLKKYLGTHILKTDIGYKLSVEGILVSNVVLSEFI